MKSIILCEGLTDCMFIQYYMRNVYNWMDDGSQSLGFTKWNRKLNKQRKKHNKRVGTILEKAEPGIYPLS